TCVYLGNLHVLVSRCIHTVEVTGSNPVAPTIRINHLQIIWVIGVAPGCSNCSAMCLKTLRDRRSPSVRIAPGAAAITPPRHRNRLGSRVPMHRALRRELP